MDYRNDEMLVVTTEDGRGYFYSPRWIAVTVSRDEHGQTVAAPEEPRRAEPWHVDVFRCECGQEYAVEHGARAQTPRCRICENAQRAAEQRRRRARSRPLAIACMVCGAPLSARRSSRKYCSPACRQRAHRKRGVDAEAM